MKLWLVRGGRHGETEAYSLDNGLAVIGWREIPDLSSVKTREEVATILQHLNPTAPAARITNHSAQLFTFAHRIALGDIVVMPLKTRAQIALGKVIGGYRYLASDGNGRHAIAMDWVRSDVPRSTFKQDLLYSFGAFMTVCEIKRNNALERIQAVLAGKTDPGDVELGIETSDESEIALTGTDLEAAIRDQITRFIQSHFSGHGLARLVAAVLEVDGYQTEVSPPGPDGGVDILAGKGPLGLESPRLVVQVKSGSTPTNVTIYRNLQGTMQTYKAELGLLVSWAGFNKAVEQEAKAQHFQIRLWDQADMLSAVFRTYDRLPEDIRAELPLTRAWLLVQSDEDTK